MPKKNSSPWAGLAIRIPKKDVGELREPIEVLLKDPSVSEHVKDRSANKLLAAMMRDSLLLAESNPFTTSRAQLLRKLRGNHDYRLIFRGIAARDIRRRIPKRDCVTVKLPFSLTDRDRLMSISGTLRWSTAQLVMEAVHTFLVIVSAEKPLEPEEVPHFLQTYRARMVYQGIFQFESAAGMRDELNKLIMPPDGKKLTAAAAPHEPLETILQLI